MNGIFGNYVSDKKELSFILNGDTIMKLKNKERAIAVGNGCGPVFG
jgi:hypothetical protein